jgi:hypothetical protein
MTNRWSVQEAKARLSEVLRRARAGKPQHIGLTQPCVVVSEEDWSPRRRTKSLGAWLVESAPRGEPLIEPSRKSRRGDPFRPESRRKRK